jgi:hypothetical protein
MEMVWLRICGRRMAASRRTSMIIAISRTSAATGNGTPVRERAMAKARGVGRSSWLTELKAMKPGSSVRAMTALM